MTPLMKWLGVCAVAAGLTFIAFASAGRLLPMRLESSATIDARDYVGVTKKEPPILYESLFREFCEYPSVHTLEFTMVETPQPEFTKVDLKELVAWKNPMTVTIHDPGHHVRRIPPIMPSTATKSGHCRLMFDVDEKGDTFNIKNTYCSEDLFAPSSIESVKQWQYPPRIVKGKPVVRKAVETKITYILQDEDGNPLPE